MEGSRTKRPFPARRWVPLAVLAAGLVLFLAVGGSPAATFDLLRRHRDDLHSVVEAHKVAAGLGFMLAYAAATAFSLPVGLAMTMFGGFLFGTAVGAACTVIAATAGATLLFAVARSTIGAVLRAKAGPMLHKMEAGFQENALSYLLFLRLVPLFPFWLVNLVAACLGMDLRAYVIGTLVGIVPATVVYASVGAGIGAVLDAGKKPQFDMIFHAEILAPLIGLAVLALVPVVYKGFKARKR